MESKIRLKTVDEMAFDYTRSKEVIVNVGITDGIEIIKEEAFKAGHAARDAEVEELKSRVEELRRFKVAAIAQLKEANEVIGFYSDQANWNYDQIVPIDYDSSGGNFARKYQKKYAVKV